MARPPNISVYLMQDAPTALSGQVLTLKAGQVVRLRGGPIGRHRKYIRITNEDAQFRVYVVAGDEQGIDPRALTVKLTLLKPQETIELWTNATITLKSLNQSNQDITPVQILELFYV